MGVSVRDVGLPCRMPRLRFSDFKTLRVERYDLRFVTAAVLTSLLRFQLQGLRFGISGRVYCVGLRGLILCV